MRIALAVLTAALAISGCEKAARNMYDGARERPLGTSGLFTDGRSSRTPPAGLVAHASGVWADSSSGSAARGAAFEAANAAAEASQGNPYPVTRALLERGRERFDIYCSPCHSPAGDGDGMVARRGFPHPPSYHSDHLRAAPDRHFYDVITLGYGVMHSYADRVAPPDRWAIVAYIRALQRSQHARREDLAGNGGEEKAR